MTFCSCSKVCIILPISPLSWAPRTLVDFKHDCHKGDVAELWMVPALSYGYLFHGYSVIKGFIKLFGKFTYKTELKKCELLWITVFSTSNSVDCQKMQPKIFNRLGTEISNNHFTQLLLFSESIKRYWSKDQSLFCLTDIWTSWIPQYGKHSS